MNKSLDVLLSFKAVLIAAILLAAAEVHYMLSIPVESQIYSNDLAGILLVTTFTLFLPMAKLEGIWFMCMGHGVHKMRKILRFPLLGFAVVFLLFVFGVVGIWAASQLSVLGWGKLSNAKSFTFSLNVVVVTLLMAARWYFVLYYRYWAASEIELRQWLHDHKVGRSKSEHLIRYFKAEGFVDNGKPPAPDAIH